MHYWIGRHGPNEMGGEAHLDRKRPLTARGVKHVAAVAAAMNQDGQSPRAIFSSLFERCMQTSDVIAKVLGNGCRVLPCDEIGPELDLYCFLSKLVSNQNDGLMLVSHHTGIERLLDCYGDGQAPSLFACGEVRQYTIEPGTPFKMNLTYRMTPAMVGMLDQITLKRVLGER